MTSFYTLYYSTMLSDTLEYFSLLANKTAPSMPEHARAFKLRATLIKLMQAQVFPQRVFLHVHVCTTASRCPSR